MYWNFQITQEDPNKMSKWVAINKVAYEGDATENNYDKQEIESTTRAFRE